MVSIIKVLMTIIKVVMTIIKVTVVINKSKMITMPPWQPVQTVSSPHFSQQPASPRQPSDTAAVVLPVMSSNLEINVQFINIQYTIKDIRRICLQATPTSERIFIASLLT